MRGQEGGYVGCYTEKWKGQEDLTVLLVAGFIFFMQLLNNCFLFCGTYSLL